MQDIHPLNVYDEVYATVPRELEILSGDTDLDKALANEATEETQPEIFQMLDGQELLMETVPEEAQPEEADTDTCASKDQERSEITLQGENLMQETDLIGMDLDEEASVIANDENILNIIKRCSCHQRIYNQKRQCFDQKTYRPTICSLMVAHLKTISRDRTTYAKAYLKKVTRIA